MLASFLQLSSSSQVLLAFLAVACLCLIGLIIFQCTSCCEKTDLYKTFVLEGEWSTHGAAESHEGQQSGIPADSAGQASDFGLLPPAVSTPDSRALSRASAASLVGSASGGLVPDLAAIVQEKPENFLKPRMRLQLEHVPQSGVVLLPNLLHMDRKHLFFLSELGQAWFGPVIDAESNRYGETLRSKVVVRLMSDESVASATAVQDKMHFLADIQAYKECVDPCVLKLIGLCTNADPFLAVLEATLTDLKSYLRTLHSDGHAALEDNLALRFASQAARGLSVLHEKGFVYQDIGARNCRVTDTMVAKIGDYGCTQAVHRIDYAEVNGELVPLRWLAPENVTPSSIGGRKLGIIDHTAQSNVWSLGVLLLELCSMAGLPHCGQTDEQLVNRLSSMQQPSDRSVWLSSSLVADSDKCCQHKRASQLWQMHELRNRCWAEAPTDRPTALQVSDRLDQLFRLESRRQLQPQADTQPWNLGLHSGPAVTSEDHSLRSMEY